MKWLLYMHRWLSGISLVLLLLDMAGYSVPSPARLVVLAALTFYLAELSILAVIALLNPRQVDVTYPLVMLASTVIAVKALTSGNILPSLITVTVMFVFGYIGGGGDEGGRLHQGKQER